MLLSTNIVKKKKKEKSNSAAKEVVVQFSAIMKFLNIAGLVNTTKYLFNITVLLKQKQVRCGGSLFIDILLDNHKDNSIWCYHFNLQLRGWHIY